MPQEAKAEKHCLQGSAWIGAIMYGDRELDWLK